MASTQGLDVSVYNASFLRQSIAKRVLKATGCETPAAYLTRLASDRPRRSFPPFSPHQLQRVFPRPSDLRPARTYVILGGSCAKQRGSRPDGTANLVRRVRAEGQEAWSVAILLGCAAAARGSQSTVRVLRNRPFRSQHRSGACWALFRAALGNVRPQTPRYVFQPQGDLYVMAERLRERVDFAVYDLLDERLPVLLRAFFGDLITPCVVMYCFTIGQKCSAYPE